MDLPTTIFLCGMPGCGKSSLGELLASKLHFQFTDLDKEIEFSTGESISQLFLEKGEAGFRKIEKSTLEKTLLKDLNRHVIALGGGTLVYSDNLDQIKSKGLLVYLKTPTDLLLKRLKNDTTRPLLKNTALEKKVTELLEQRDPIYQKAHLTINTTESMTDNLEALWLRLQTV